MPFSRRIPRLALAWTLIGILAVAPLRAAGSWKVPVGELARIIAAQIGSPTTVTLTVRNASTLTDSDAGAVRQTLRLQLRSQGFHFLRADRAKVEVHLTLSENADGYLWIAEIGSGDSRVVRMLSVPRVPPGPEAAAPEPLAIRKAFVIERAERILDFSLLAPDADGTPRILLLEPEQISVLKKPAGSWVAQQSVSLTHPKPWPRDLRGRLLTHLDESFEVYLPGVRCAGTVQPPLNADCHESNDPWPLDSKDGVEMAARFVADRNFFEGTIALGSAQEISLPPFYSAAEIPGRGGLIRAFAGVDGRVRLIEKGPEPVATWEAWGSNVVSVRSGCGKGGQWLATKPGDGNEADAVQAFEISGGRALPVSPPVEFPGPVTEMWPTADGATAAVIGRNLKTGDYEAFTLSISCGQ